MQNEIGITFDGQSKIYSFDPQNKEYKLNDLVVVETVRGIEIGKVSKEIQPFKNAEHREPLKNVLRKATEQDLARYEGNKKKALDYLQRTKKIVENMKLNMQLIKAELTLDGYKIIISFTSDGRVDFRELVRKLANEFRLRIELRQVSVNDEIRLLKSIGPCGRECCCVNMCCERKKNSIKMAKMQGLALGPNSINGLCNRLKCCLSYENEEYANNFKVMPKVGSEVETPDGKGKALYNYILKKIVQVKVNDTYKEYPLEELKVYKTNGSMGENNDRR